MSIIADPSDQANNCHLQDNIDANDGNHDAVGQNKCSELGIEVVLTHGDIFTVISVHLLRQISIKLLLVAEALSVALGVADFEAELLAGKVILDLRNGLLLHKFIVEVLANRDRAEVVTLSLCDNRVLHDSFI